MRYLIILSLALFACNSPKEAPRHEGPEIQQKTPDPKKKVVKKAAKAPKKAAKAPEGALTVAGKIVSISGHAESFKLKDDKSGKLVVVRYDDNTKLQDAEDFSSLKTRTQVQVVYLPGKAAFSIKRVLVKLDPALIYSTKQVEALLQGKTPFTLVDARPAKRYSHGHIAQAISIFANTIAEHADQLPKDKNQLVVFYCGGVTCGLSSKAAKWAKANGYTNVKVYQAGMPAWKKAGHAPVVEPALVKDQLNVHTVIIDTRAPEAIKAGHLPGAVAFDLAAMKKRAAALEAAGVKHKRLPNVRDKKAPIIVYGDDAMAMFKALKGFGYKRVALLTGGYAGWKAAKQKVAKGAAATEFKYTKRVVPGAVDLATFKAAMQSKAAVFVDVRTPEEYAKNKLPGAISLPLDAMDGDLSALPKDKLVYLYCVSGTRASIAWAKLTAKGYDKVKFLDDLTSAARPKAAPAK